MYGSIRAPKDTANANSTPKPDEACASLVTGTCALPVTSTVDIVTTTVVNMPNDIKHFHGSYIACNPKLPWK